MLQKSGAGGLPTNGSSNHVRRRPAGCSLSRIQLDRCDPECLRPRPRHPRKIDKRDATHVSLSHQGQAPKRLNSQAQAINLIWNYCNETQMKAARDGRKWLSGYDLWKLVAGCTKQGLDLHSHSAMRV